MREGLRDTLTRMAGAAPGPRAPWTLLWGIAGTGKTEISARLAAHAGQPLLAFDAMAADKTARLELLRLAQRDALALGATLYVGPLAVSDDATAAEPRRDPRHRPRGPGLIAKGLGLDLPEREQLWRSFLPHGVPRDPDLDVETLAREFELTGGLIKNVVVRAAFLAAREDQKLGTGLLRRAATLELEDMGRVVRAA